MTESDPALSAEDAKLVTLARATRARIRAAQGAAVRDTDGRTYAAASVALESLTLSALQVCVAMAVASGSRGLEAAVLLADPPDPTSPDPTSPGPTLDAADASALAEFGGPDVVVHLGLPTGAVTTTLTLA